MSVAWHLLQVLFRQPMIDAQRSSILSGNERAEYLGGRVDEGLPD